MTAESRAPDYFDALYARNTDPWDFENSAYEHEKYNATIAALGGRRFASVFEVGCSIGVLTARLAAHCDRLLAVDVVDSALARAKTRCADLAHVNIENRRMPQDWPPDGATFDLIVLSEILYFLSQADIEAVAQKAWASLQQGGFMLLVNYTETIDEPCSGGEAAEIFIAACRMSPMLHMGREKYRIDLLGK